MRLALLQSLEEAAKRDCGLVFLRQHVGSVWSPDVRVVCSSHYVARRDDAPMPARACGIYFPADSVGDAIGESWGPWAMCEEQEVFS